MDDPHFDPTAVFLHKVSAWVVETQTVLEACNSVLNIVKGNSSNQNSVRTDSSGRIEPGELTRLISTSIIENGTKVQGREKDFSRRIKDKEKAINGKQTLLEQAHCVCAIQVILEEYGLPDLLLDHGTERFTLNSLTHRLRSQVESLTEMEYQIHSTFALGPGASGVDVELELRALQKRYNNSSNRLNREVRFSRPPRLVSMAMIEPNSFKRILSLFMENALKYNFDDPKGTPSWITLSVEEKSSHVHVTVESWGCPVFRDEEEKVIVRGERGQAAKILGYAGNGQGLAEARHLAQMFNGDVRIWSKDRPSRSNWVRGTPVKTYAQLRVPNSDPDQAHVMGGDAPVEAV